jgi:hypothetical protein
MRPNNRRDLYSISLTRYGTVDPFEINGILTLAQEMISLSLSLLSLCYCQYLAGTEKLCYRGETLAATHLT